MSSLISISNTDNSLVSSETSKLVNAVNKVQSQSALFDQTLHISMKESIAEIGTHFEKEEVLRERIYNLANDCADALKDGNISKAKLVCQWIKYKSNEEVQHTLLRDHMWVTIYLPKMKEKDITEPGSEYSWSNQLKKIKNYSHMYGYWYCDKTARQIQSAVILQCTF